MSDQPSTVVLDPEAAMPPVSGRDRELAALHAALGRARNGGAELVAVVGPPGSGRTTLLEAFVTTASETTVGLGSFDAAEAGGRDGLRDAVRGLARSILGRSDAVVESWTRWIRSELGSSTAELVALVPELEVVLGAPVDAVDQPDVEGARNRYDRAVTALVRSTARVAGPATLVIDNLHRANGVTVDLLGVLASSLSDVLIVVGSRSEDTTHVDELAAEAPGFRRLDLRPLTRPEVRRWLRDAYELDLGDDVLDQIELRAQGNPLLIEQLLTAADGAGALRRDGTTSGRSLDPAWLRGQPVGDDVAASLADRVTSLPAEHVRVLGAAACLGGPFRIDDVAVGTGLDPSEVAAAVWAGIESGIVVGDVGDVHDVGPTEARLTLDRHYRFAHDRLADVSRAALGEAERAEVHLRLGRHRRDAGDLVAGVHHLARCVPLLDEHERLDAARTALAAASDARRSADFSVAHACFADGNTLVEGSTGDPELRSQLRFGLADCSRLVGDPDIDDHLDAAMEAAVGSVERASVAVLRMKVWLAHHRQREALDVGIAALAELGISIPKQASSARSGVAIARTAAALRKFDIDELAALPPATDPAALVAGELLAELFSITYTVAQDLFALVIVRAVDLTLAAGRLPVSPVAFASYGQVLVHLGRYDAARRYGELALRLADEPDCAVNRPWTIFLFHGFLATWHLPVRESVAPVRAAYEEAMLVGDHENAGYLAATELRLMSVAGAPLDALEARATELSAALSHQPKQRELCEGVRQYAHNLMGRNPEPMVLGGTTGYDERVVVPRARASDDQVALAVHSSLRLGLHFWAGDYAGAVEVATAVEDFAEGVQGSGGMSTGLIPSVIARLRHEPDAPATKRAVRKLDRLLSKWAKGSPENYEAVALLIRAERAIAAGRYDRAERLCMETIKAADRHDSGLIGVRAREAAALVYTRTDRATAARGYLLEAAALWADLGYLLRLQRLCDEYPWLANEIDLDVAVDAARPAPPSDTDAGSLLEALVAEVIDVAACDRVLVIIRRHESLQLVAGGDASPDGSVIEIVEPPAAIVDGGPYAATMLRLAARLGEAVTSERAATDWSDAYLRGLDHAVAVVPITDRGRTVAELHLERAEPFDDRVLRDVEARARNAVLSIENALLERELTSVRDRHASLEAAQAKLVPTEYLETFGAADIQALESGGVVEREWSSLFSDIRGYATLTESLPVDEVNEVVTDFLRAVEPAIVAHDGFVHDTRGDEVLALFRGGADDALHAGLGMVRAKRALAERRSARGLAAVDWGVGINHGLVYLGVVEGVNHRKAGVLGDSINLASRIESLTKRYASELLVTDRVVAELSDPGRFRIRRAERVRVVSRRVPTMVFEVFDHDPADLLASKIETAPLLDEAFAAYDALRWDEAGRLFELVLRSLPGDRIASLHLDACRRFAADGAPPGWDGTTHLTSK